MKDVTLTVKDKHGTIIGTIVEPEPETFKEMVDNWDEEIILKHFNSAKRVAARAPVHSGTGNSLLSKFKKAGVEKQKEMLKALGIDVGANTKVISVSE